MKGRSATSYSETIRGEFKKNAQLELNTKTTKWESKWGIDNKLQIKGVVYMKITVGNCLNQKGF